jgi:folate-binding protein YgfZ
MNQNWLDFLSAQSARIDSGEAIHFGDARSELSQAQTETILASLTDFSLIRATGEEAAGFLHNLLSNDVQHLDQNHAERASFCSPKGRMLADFLIWREGHDYLMQLSADIQPAMLKKLSMYLLRSKAKLTDAGSEFVLLGLAGSGMAEALKAVGATLPAAAMETARFSEGTVIRLDATRCQLVVVAGAAEQTWRALSAAARPVGTPVWRWLDIAAGVPHIRQATQDEFVPQMTNQDLLGGLSFTKGCYPGQEIVARTKYLGKVKRRTYRARIDANCPAPGTDLYSPDLPDQSCGKVIEAAPGPAGGCEFLASMLMASAEGGDIHVGAADGPRLAFLPLPYALE